MRDCKKIIFIVGPTSVGKSKAAVFLASKINGEIISCDSMQVYKEVNIASNKCLAKGTGGIPQHLVNIISVEDDFDVARFNELARGLIKEIHGRGRIPIIAGGSGMYMQVLLDGIFESSERDWNLRKELALLANEKGAGFLFKQLKKKDPRAADKIHPNDLKRIIRSLEVYACENSPISVLQKCRTGLWGKYNIKIFALNRERSLLYKRIDDRVDQMFRQGVVDEIKKLGDLRLSRTSERIIGVKEIRGYLRNEYGLDNAVYLMKLNTRHFAKRQLTWFRKDKRLTWIMIKPENTQEDVASKIMSEKNEK